MNGENFTTKYMIPGMRRIKRNGIDGHEERNTGALLSSLQLERPLV
jgi:hypothetical protein